MATKTLNHKPSLGNNDIAEGWQGTIKWKKWIEKWRRRYKNWVHQSVICVEGIL